ncbi:MAG TPA: LysR family transcriptional regulator [Jatrophihabitans sp.]|nr:LysR family transcriptional regulator [Jatrophihabitans sp.]
MHSSEEVPGGGGVELRLLGALVAVAEESSVSAAAARLRIAQPSLSRQLRLLERRLGMPLFERSGRRLRVTPAAEPVVDAARHALASADDVISVAHRAAAGRTGRLAIAVQPGCSPLLFMDALSAFRRSHPLVETSMIELPDREQQRGLRDGRLDLALTRLAPPAADLPHEVLIKEPLSLVVPPDHRLAGADRTRLAELTGENVIFYPRAEQPVAHEWLTAQLRAAGLPTTLHEASLTNILATVAAGLAVSVLVSTYEAVLRPPNVRFIPLDGLTVDLIMTRPVGRESPPLSAFRRELTRALRGTAAAGRPSCA